MRTAKRNTQIYTLGLTRPSSPRLYPGLSRVSSGKLGSPGGSYHCIILSPSSLVLCWGYGVRRKVQALFLAVLDLLRAPDPETASKGDPSLGGRQARVKRYGPAQSLAR